MSVNVTMPKLGMTMKVGKVSKRYKKEGDSVEKGGMDRPTQRNCWYIVKLFCQL